MTREATMRIQGPTAAAIASSAPAPRRAANGSFAVSDAESGCAPVPATTLRSVGGIDALIALQGLEDPAERRRRAVKQGRRALDALDELKLGLLAGNLDPATLRRLKAAAVDLKGGSGEDGLDGVLAEIDLRVEVELAKAGMA
jgi:hypothetical protein